MYTKRYTPHPFVGVNFMEETELTSRGPHVVTAMEHVARIAQEEKCTDLFAATVLLEVLNRQTTHEAKVNVKKDKYRRRSAEQILQEGVLSCCSDDAIIFAAVLRGMGYPVCLAETFEQLWLYPSTQMLRRARAFRRRARALVAEARAAYDSPDWNPVFGRLVGCWESTFAGDPTPRHLLPVLLFGAPAQLNHVFVDLLDLDGQWKRYDPSVGTCGLAYRRGRYDYIAVARGLDYSCMYVRDPRNGLYEAAPVSLDSAAAVMALAGRLRKRSPDRSWWKFW